MKISYGKEKKENNVYHIHLNDLSEKEFNYIRAILITDFNSEIHREMKENMILDKLIENSQSSLQK